MRIIALSLFILLTLNLTTQSQNSISGLWEVLKVTVGEEELTPTAKWFLFTEKGQMEGGNGGFINTRGTFDYDAVNNTLEQMATDQRDPYETFDIQPSADKENMTWARTEDGMQVKVQLKKLKEKPLAPWDKITGSWSVEGVSNYASIYIGWDGRYRKFNENGQRIETGLWHIEAHSPWL